MIFSIHDYMYLCVSVCLHAYIFFFFKLCVSVSLGIVCR